MSVAAAIGAVVGYVQGLAGETTLAAVVIVCMAGSIVRDICRGW